MPRNDIDHIVDHIQHELRMRCDELPREECREVLEKVKGYCLVVLHAISDQQANEER